MIHFTLYSRSYCHLCEEMLYDLHTLLATEKIAIEVVDVDGDPDLVAQYDELVPVLIGHRADGSASRLCHYFLDHPRVVEFCSAQVLLQLTPVPR